MSIPIKERNTGIARQPKARGIRGAYGEGESDQGQESESESESEAEHRNETGLKKKCE